jgi:hypothetical protein
VSDEGRGRPLPRRLGIALAAIPLLGVVLADATVVVHRAAQPAQPTASPRHATSHAARVTQGGFGPAPTQALRALLSRRGDAVVHHNRAEWLSTVDPKSPGFLRRQAAVFDNMRSVPFASWSYSFDPSQPQLPYRTTARYHAPVWSPATFALHYRLRGFDQRPTNLAQYPTFVRRGARWYIASFSDFAGEGLKSARDLWDFGPVVTWRRPHVLVLGHPGSQPTMSDVADEITAAIPRVSAVWRNPWPRRIVALVPRTQHELAQVVDDFSDLDHIAAVATAEIQTHTGHPDPVGERVGINPHNWPQLSELGRQIVITHELTHVATRAWTGGATPTWLAEGFADYVGYLDSGVPTRFAAQELAADVRAGHVPHQLPPDVQFDGSSKRLAQAYEEAWLACRMIAERWGTSKLTEFYRAVGRSPNSPAVAVATEFPRVLHIGGGRFVREWRSYLRAQLS